MTVNIMKFEDGFIPPNPIEVDSLVDNMERFEGYIIPNVHVAEKPKHWINWKKMTLAQIDSDIKKGLKISQLFICINDPDNPPGLKIVTFPYTIENANNIVRLIEEAP